MRLNQSGAYTLNRRRFRSTLIRRLLACTVLASALPYAGEAHTAANDDDSLGYTRADWMGELPDDTPFTELSVLGTHDTMAYDGLRWLTMEISSLMPGLGNANRFLSANISKEGFVHWISDADT